MTNTKGETMGTDEYRDFQIKGETFRIYLNGKPADWKDLMRAGWRPVNSLSSGEFAGTELAKLFRGGSQTPVYSRR